MDSRNRHTLVTFKTVQVEVRERLGGGGGGGGGVNTAELFRHGTE